MPWLTLIWKFRKLILAAFFAALVGFFIWHYTSTIEKLERVTLEKNRLESEAIERDKQERKADEIEKEIRNLDDAGFIERRNRWLRD